MIWLILGCLYAASVCVAAGALTVIDFRDNEPTTSWFEHGARGVALVFVALAWPVVLLLGWSKRKAAPLPPPQPPGLEDSWDRYRARVEEYNSSQSVPPPGRDRRAARYDPHQHGEGI